MLGIIRKLSRDLFGKRLTVETVLEPTSSPELCAFGRFSRKKRVESKAEKVVGKVSENGIPGDQTGEARPPSLLLELLKVQSRRVKQGWYRAAVDVIAQEGESIAK